MSETAVIFMSNGKTYTVSTSPASLHQSLIKDEQSGDFLKQFHLLNGKEILINPAHVVAVESSELSNMDVSTSDKTTPVSDKNRKDANLKAVREFKDDIDGNME
ncbi:MAG: hypothetical protein JJU16_10270 [Alkalibacterium sp.]|nr:hypothetical protein [Alkalibacterium sp.]